MQQFMYYGRMRGFFLMYDATLRRPFFISDVYVSGHTCQIDSCLAAYIEFDMLAARSGAQAASTAYQREG